MESLVENRKAYFDHEILEKFEAGLSLTGFEAKAIKKGMASLAGARVIIRAGEAFAVGIQISPYQASNLPPNFEEQRTIRLLLNKKEINYLTGKLSQKGLTIIPIKVYASGSRLKMEIALAKGKKKFDKREKIKEREEKRKIERAVKEQ